MDDVRCAFKMAAQLGHVTHVQSFSFQVSTDDVKCMKCFFFFKKIFFVVEEGGASAPYRTSPEKIFEYSADC